MQRPFCAIAQNRWVGIQVSYGEIAAPVRTRPLWGNPGRAPSIRIITTPAQRLNQRLSLHSRIRDDAIRSVATIRMKPSKVMRPRKKEAVLSGRPLSFRSDVVGLMRCPYGRSERP
jgi:hypothetical protein